MCEKASVPGVRRALEDEEGEQAELGQKLCRGGHRLPLCSALGTIMLALSIVRNCPISYFIGPVILSV